jgi:3-oxoacyl-[acyl-carrier protein] reductase
MMLDGKVTIVTGGSRGIGRACVLSVVGHGSRVVFCSRTDGTDSRDVEAAAGMQGGPGAAIGIAADVTDEASVGALFDLARERYGAVHCVVNNAAVSREQLLVSTATADWDVVMNVNLTGCFLVARAALRCFLEQGTGGRIVAIGTLSQNGVVGNASYAVSKGGLAGLTRHIARRYARFGVGSSMVVPGYVETPMSAAMSDDQKRALIDGCPLRRAGSPAEIASVVTFLLAASTIVANGRAIFATGGLTEVPP